MDVEFSYNTKYLGHANNVIQTDQGDFQANKDHQLRGSVRRSSGPGFWFWVKIYHDSF